MTFIRSAFVFGIALMACANTASAALKTWTNSASPANWNTSANNWNSGSTNFNPGDDARFLGGSGQPAQNIFIGTSPTAADITISSLTVQGGYGTNFTFTGGDILGGSATVNMNQDNTANFDRAGSYSFGGGTNMNANNGNVNYRPGVAGNVHFGSGAINLNSASANFRFQPTVAGANLTNDFVVGSSGGRWHATTNGGTLSGSVTLNGNLALQSNSVLANNVIMNGDRAITGGMWGGNHPVINGFIDGAGVSNLTLTTTSSQDAYLNLAGSGGWNIKDVIKSGASTTGILRFATDESTFFSGMTSNGGTFRIQQGNVQWQNSNPSITFAMSISPNSGFYATSPLTMDVDTGGVLGGTGTYASKNSPYTHTWTNNVTIDVNNGGMISPGDSAGALGVTGSVNFNTGSTLKIELGGTTAGTDYDQLNVSGNVVLGGTLDISFINGFDELVDAGDTFTILSAGGLSGMFDDLQLGRVNTTDGQGSFLVSISGNNVLLSNFEVPPIPEPSTALLLGLGLIGFAARKRRQQRS